jgi:hypothetical protein
VDTSRFDALARTIGAPASRRGVLGGLAAGLSALLGMAVANDDAEAKSKKCKSNQRKCKGKCISKSKCCSNGDCSGGAQSKNEKCKCPAGTKSCSNVCIPEDDCCINADCDPCETCTDGACSEGCAAGQKCVEEECVCTTESCAGCCAEDETCGSGDDPTACGTDGEQCIACDASETCPSGECVCAAPFTQCGTDCVDTATDANNCGGCGTDCPAGA